MGQLCGKSKLLKKNQKRSFLDNSLSLKYLQTLNNQEITYLYRRFNKISQEGKANFEGFKKFFPKLEEYPVELQRGAFLIFKRNNEDFVTFRDFIFILTKFLINNTYRKSFFVYEWLSYIKISNSTKAEIATIDEFLKAFLIYDEEFGLNTLFKISYYDKSLDEDFKSIIDYEKLLVPFEVYLTPKREKQLIFPMMASKLKKRQVWFIINRKWKLKWKNYLDTEDRINRPGPINNRKLVSELCEMDLKEDIKSSEFSLIPKKAWKILLQIYGGGPALPRPAIKKEKTLVELKPFIFEEETSEGLKFITVSKTQKVKHILKESNRAPQSYQVFLLNSEENPLLLQNEENLIEVCVKRVNRCKIKCIYEENLKKKKKKQVEKIIKFSGIKNFYNNCYISSVLQSFVHTPLISIYFCHQLYKRDLKEFSIGGKSTILPKIIGESVYKIMNFPKVPFDPTELIKQFEECKEDFLWREQQDAHEFLRIFLDWLSEDLCKSHANIEYNEKKSNSTNSITNLRGSIINDLYGGLFERTLKCRKCDYQNELFEVFLDLSIPLPLEIPFEQYKVVFVPFKSNPIINFFFTLETPIENVEEEIKQKLDLNESSIYLGIVSNHKFINEADYETAKLIISDRKKIHAYEIPNNLIDTVNIPVNMYKTSKKGCESIGIPLVLPFNINSDCLYLEIIEFCRCYSTIKSKKKLMANLQVFLLESDLENVCVLCTNQYCLGCEMSSDSIIPSAKRLNSSTVKVIWKKREKLDQQVEEVLDEEKKTEFSLLDCLERNFLTEYLQCQFCETKTSLLKLKIKIFPDILIIHLKRFHHLGNKLRNLVNFPVEGLNLKKWCKKTEENCNYDLFAIINHEGTNKNGHYFSYCLH